MPKAAIFKNFQEIFNVNLCLILRVFWRLFRFTSPTFQASDSRGVCKQKQTKIADLYHFCSVRMIFPASSSFQWCSYHLHCFLIYYYMTINNNCLPVSLYAKCLSLYLYGTQKAAETSPKSCKEGITEDNIEECNYQTTNREKDTWSRATDYYTHAIF